MSELRAYCQMCKTVHNPVAPEDEPTTPAGSGHGRVDTGELRRLADDFAEPWRTIVLNAASELDAAREQERNPFAMKRRALAAEAALAEARAENERWDRIGDQSVDRIIELTKNLTEAQHKLDEARKLLAASLPDLKLITLAEWSSRVADWSAS